jgi:type I restriction enzyme, R subunit
LNPRILVLQPNSCGGYPRSLNTGAKRALYDNLNRDEELVLALDMEIINTRKDGWRHHVVKRREVKNAIKLYIDDAEDAERVFEIVKSQNEY